MSQKEPLSDHLPSLTLDSPNTLSKESDSGSSTQCESVIEYASEEENARFHKEFPNVPKDERLLVDVNDSRSTLYISEKHMYSRYLDKKSMISMDDIIALYIQRDRQNSICKFQLITRHTTLNEGWGETTYSGSNAVYRAFSIIRNRWSACLRRASVSRRDLSLENLTFKQTECMCSKEGSHGKVYMEGVFLGTPKEIHHLLFMSEVGKDLWCKTMKETGYKDIQISDWSSAGTTQGQGHSVQDIHYRCAEYPIKMCKEIIHCNFNDYISIVTRGSTPSSCLNYNITQCIMWETAESSRVILTEDDEDSAWFSPTWTYLGLIDQLWSLLCDNAVQKLDGIYVLLSLETAQDMMFSRKPSELAPVLDLILSKGTPPNLSLDYHQRYMKFLQLLIKKHNFLPPSLFREKNLNTLFDLDPETVDTILHALEPSRVSSVLDLLIAKAKSPDLDHQKHIEFLGLLAAKKLELNHEYCRKCLKWLRLLVNKHHMLPPLLFLQDITIPSLQIAAVGGYSDIYKGEFENKQVCLKVLRVYIEDGEEKRNKSLRDFYKETLLWTHLNHSNLLPFLGVNTTLFPGKLALVAPWMANGEITKFLKESPTHDRLKVISAIAAGIMYLHSRNIVHGDIKGANVLVDELGNCYLADFGLATAAMTSTLLSTTTSSGGKGTMRWMAPELLASEDTEDDDESSDHLDQDRPKPNVVQLARDIYAYACTVYEIIAGKIPFAHLRHDGQVIIQVINGKRPNRPTTTAWCPNSIWNLVEQCWAQECHLRPTAADVHGFLIHLEELQEKKLSWEEELLSL